MEEVTKAQYDRDMNVLTKQLADLKAMITPFVAAELDGEKVVDWREACKITKLTPHGLADARRGGRIATNIKLNGKEYGYKIKELDKYNQRYRYNGN